MSEAETQYEVERILAHRDRRGRNGVRREYLIKWKHYSEKHNSWEPESNIQGCSQLIHEYRGRMAKRTSHTVQCLPLLTKRAKKKPERYQQSSKQQRKRPTNSVIQIVSSGQEQRMPELPASDPGKEMAPTDAQLPRQPQVPRILHHYIGNNQLYFLVREGHLQRSMRSQQLQVSYQQLVLSYLKGQVINRAKEQEPPRRPIPDLPNFEDSLRDESSFAIEYLT